ncbi:3-oxo-5-alpha-steroid 4-dehydrogenase [Anaeramoeba flamelloides]|uniref:3-oxo-5-alpha-steroid 4-dehydrogenase n=1 Tax=Anaeramoeba flamelloides TaxID=1746091 RepID=A0ABQ8ZG72_9EUKA|nr:3-oxo-5-alpha-steroid 4-dehydrogenase [Anaeramoeba flamelloides]
MIGQIFFYLGISMALQVVFFIFAFLFKSDKFTDMTYSLTFLTISIVSLLLGTGKDCLATILQNVAVWMWSLRLGSYLVYRIHKIGVDHRFDQIRDSLLKFGGFWFIQGLSVWFVILPTVIVNLNPPLGSIHWTNILGWVIFFIGLIIETIADYQKFVFKNKPENKKNFMKSGIWSWSRHPNYFGELAVWVGLFISSIASIALNDNKHSESQTDYALQWTLAALGPLWITFVILFFSGIPPLERGWLKRYGDRNDFIKWKKTTSILIPIPPKLYNLCNPWEEKSDEPDPFEAQKLLKKQNHQDEKQKESNTNEEVL